jgi:hypothetical protein
VYTRNLNESVGQTQDYERNVVYPTFEMSVELPLMPFFLRYDLFHDFLAGRREQVCDLSIFAD